MLTLSVMDLLRIICSAELKNKEVGFTDQKIEEIKSFLQKVTWDSYTEELLFIDEVPFKIEKEAK